MSEAVMRYTTFWFFLACFLCSAYFAGFILSPFFPIILLASIIAGIFFPIYKFISNKLSLIAAIASFITCLLIFLILFLPAAFFVGIMVQEILDLVNMVKSSELTTLLNKLWIDSYALETINAFLSNFGMSISADELNATFSRIGKTIGLFLYEQARAIASNALSLFVNALLMLLIIFFLLIDGEGLIRFIMDLSPLPTDQDEKLIGKFSDMAGAILIGNGLCSAIQGLFGGFIFWFFDLPSALLWGVIMTFLAFLPVIGIGVILLPTAVYLFITGRVITSLLIVIFYVLLSGGTEYIIKPKVVGHRVKMHTLLVFLSFIGGLKVFGILGIIYGPLITTAFLTLTDIYLTNYRNLNYNDV